LAKLKIEISNKPNNSNNSSWVKLLERGVNTSFWPKRNGHCYYYLISKQNMLILSKQTKKNHLADFVFVGLRWPSLVAVNLHWPLLAIIGLCWSLLAAV
jgi:hypothetical protein